METLLSNFGKWGVNNKLSTVAVDIEDTLYSSKYFNVVEFDPIFTAGKNAVAFNGSSLLQKSSEIQVQCIDSNNNSLYIEYSKSNVQYSDLSKFVLSIHVYDEVYDGPGKLILVGKTTKGEIVRWTSNIVIDKTKQNVSRVRFQNTPTIEVRPLLYPVVNTSLISGDAPPQPPPKIPSAIAHIRSIIDVFTIVDGGSGYTSTPTVKITDGGYGFGVDVEGAQATATITDGVVTAISFVTNGNGIVLRGVGLTSTPTIEIIGGTPTTTAIVTATILSDVVSIDIVDGGGGYSQDYPPNITISPNGAGHGAKAIATVEENGTISSISVTNGGVNYINVPSVKFPLPPISNGTFLNVPVTFPNTTLPKANFYTYAANPTKGFNKKFIDIKRIAVQYTLTVTNISDEDLRPTLFPEKSFNTQMEGKSFTVNISKIQHPSTLNEISVDLNETFIIKKVIDSKTILLESPFYYQVGKDQLITNILEGTFRISYNYVKYNTRSESALTIPNPAGDNAEDILILKSYAEVLYRNLNLFTGFVARHKLYRKSLAHPGDFQLLSDEILTNTELLTDIITFNKAYDKIGYFYNEESIAKYWYPTNGLTLEAKTFPINSMYIYGNSFDDVDGTKYVIAKTDSVVQPGTSPIINDNKYYNYNQSDFDNLSGQSYNSNFISLKKDVLYVLSSNIIIEKDRDNTDAGLSFYFTSSISDIRKEITYNPSFGMKLGEVLVPDQTNTKYFSKKQSFYFTPTEDYYGTLVLVPYHCNATLSELSLKIYGDYGFSQDSLLIRIPFPVNIANESFEIKSELFDINSNLVFSDLKTTQTFDVDGKSDTLISYNINDINPTINSITTITTNPDTGQQSLVMPPPMEFVAPGEIQIPTLIPTQDVPQRFVGWFTPSDDPTTSGKLCYTNVSNLFIENSDYISLSTVNENIETTVTALAIKNNNRRIYIDISGNKHISP